MRSTVIILSLFVSAFSVTSCKSKKSATSSANTTTNAAGSTTSSSTSASTSNTTTEAGNNQGAFVGKVSHKYRAGGCSSVIIIPGEAGEIVLIPKDKLKGDVDTDGQVIKFDYHTLKMPQPAGCSVGIPAEITNITKMK